MLKQSSDVESETAVPIKLTMQPLNVFASLKTGLLSLFTKRKQHEQTLEESVTELIDTYDNDEEAVSEEEKTFLKNIFSFGDRIAADICVPRQEMVTADENISLTELATLFVEEGHSRIPLYQGSLDRVKGFVHIKDIMPLLLQNKPFDSAHLLRKILFVPPTMRLTDLLVQMRTDRIHMAVVLDEYGGTDGLITIEDVLEQIIGTIEDEHDAIDPREIQQIDPHTLEVSGKAAIEEVEAYMQVTLATKETKEDCQSLGGLLCVLFNYVPTVQETIEHPEGLRFTVMDADPRRVKRVRIVSERPITPPKGAAT